MPLIDRVVRHLARYSQGLQLAVEHGPQAGPVTEYVCDNKPSGSGWRGQYGERWFLALPTNKGTRERTHTTKELVREILLRRRSASEKTVILDVASGTARYLRELVKELDRADDLTIVCHDRSPRQVMWGRELVSEEKLGNFTFSVGDATDDASYLTRHDPDLILAMQLFPYLHKDEEVHTVLKLAFAHLRPGGCFLCTTTVKPPTGSSFWSADAFGRKPKCRAAETMKAWMIEAGFTQVDQRYSEPNGFALIGWKQPV